MKNWLIDTRRKEKTRKRSLNRLFFFSIDTREDLNRSSRIFYKVSNVEKEVTYEEDS